MQTDYITMVIYFRYSNNGEVIEVATLLAKLGLEFHSSDSEGKCAHTLHSVRYLLAS